MAVDITLLFKASVKTVKTRNKALGVSRPETDILRRSRPRGEFSARARDVVNNIGKLKDFLLEHRKDYINACSHVTSKYSRMTDTERDQIDQDAQTFMRTCSDAIQQLRTEAYKDTVPPQVKEHRNTILDFIADYLRRVCKLYSEQRAIRVKRVVDKKRLSRLEPGQIKKIKTLPSSETTTVGITESKEDVKSVGEDTDFIGPFPGKLLIQHIEDRVMPDTQHTSGLWDDSRGEDELSPEEIQMFEEENQRLVGEMNSLCDEVRQIEGKVVEISRLQEIFAEKVLHQEADIDNIHQLVVGATENIKEGNEDIREAIKNNAGFRESEHTGVTYLSDVCCQSDFSVWSGYQPPCCTSTFGCFEICAKSCVRQLDFSP